MGLISYTNGQTSVILRVKIFDSSVSTGAGKTGLAYNTTGLIISTIADNEASPTVYTLAASHTQAVSVLGTYAAPTASYARFSEVDATNHPGIYEIQLADARFGVSGAKSLLVSISGMTAANAAQCDAVIPLTAMNPYDGVRQGMTALANAAAGASGGLLISGSNAGTTTLGALTVTGATTLTGAVSLGSTLGVTGLTTLGGLTTGAFTCSTLTATGAVALQSTLAVTGPTTLASVALTTLTASGAVALQSTVTITGATTFTGGIDATTLKSIATAIFTDALVSTDFSTAGSIGYKLCNIVGTLDSATLNFVPYGVTATGGITATYTPVGVSPNGGVICANLASGGLLYNNNTNWIITDGSGHTWTGPVSANNILSAHYTLAAHTDVVLTAISLATVGSQMDLVNAPNATALIAIANALLDLANGIEMGITPRQAIRQIGATPAGKSSGAAGTSPSTITVLGLDDATTRAVWTVDANGNRTAVTRTL
jgi:hypothetical protein